MAGNSSRKGAIRQSKKGPSAGTGGNNKRRLEEELQLRTLLKDLAGLLINY